MTSILTLICLLGSPDRQAIVETTTQLLQLLEINDAEARYDELRRIEQSQPDQRFTEMHLQALQKIVGQGSTLASSAAIETARQILAAYGKTVTASPPICRDRLNEIHPRRLSEISPLDDDF